jgi:predicted PurR-regulated permease PerM
MTDVAGRNRTAEWRTPSVVFFSIIAIAVLWAAVRILLPFSGAIIVGAFLAIVTFPWYRRIRARVGGREQLATFLTLGLLTLVIVIPGFILVMLLIQQANELFARLRAADVQKVMASMNIADHLRWIQHRFPTFDPEQINPNRLILPLIDALPAWVATHGAAIVGGIADMLLAFGLMVLAIYFFFLQGEKLIAELKVLSPLQAEYDDQLLSKFESVVNATFRGQLSTSIAHGAATAVGFAIAGLPGSIFWGAVAAIASVIPVVGASVIWGPAAIYLFVAASSAGAGWFSPIFLTIWGLTVISMIDNVVRPMVMKGESEMSAIPLLFAIIGGLKVFGFIGLLIGPLILALLITVIDIYSKSFGAGSGKSALEQEPGDPA